MNILIPVLVAFILVSCSPIIQDMPDKQNYNDAKLTYDSIEKTSPDSLYERCNNDFGNFLDRYPESSYRDNALYYRGRLNQKWSDSNVKEVSSEDVLENGIRYFQMIQNNESFYNEALYRIANSYDELYQLDLVDIELVISSYKNVLDTFPNGSNRMDVIKRLEELENEE